MKHDGEDRKALDDFWDIDAITPKKGKLTPHRVLPAEEISFGRPAEAPAPVESIPRRGESSDRHEAARRALAEAEKKARVSQTELEYQPDNSLIKTVRICKWPTSYSFYEKFLSDAQRYYRVKCEESPYVPFFSYMPQYNQMNIDQLRYYIWWRRGLRHGVYAKADYSYIFLYLYELINLNTESTPENRMNAMCDVWLAYRETCPKLDRYIGEWLCDFCLIHMLPPPLEKLEPIIEDVVSIVSLREFYMPEDSRAHALTLLNFVKRNNNYRYTASSTYNDKSKKLFEEHLYAAVVYAIEKTQHIKEGEQTLSDTRVSRASYNGALCVCEAKRRIDIEYLSLNQTYRFKGLITSFVKCSENGIRAALGIKTRLSTPGLSSEGISAINEYYAVNLPPFTAVKPKPKAEEDIRYEYYDAPDASGGFSHNDALDIENKSWELTGELVEEEVKEEPAAEITEIAGEPDAPNLEPPVQNGDEYAALCRSLSPSQLKYLTLTAAGDIPGANESAYENGMLPQAVADAINSLAADLTGDIILEDSRLVEDYKDDVISALKRL